MAKSSIALRRQKAVSLYPVVDGDRKTDTNNELWNAMLDHDRRTILGPPADQQENGDGVVGSTGLTAATDGKTAARHDIKDMLLRCSSHGLSETTATDNPLLGMLRHRELSAAVSIIGRIEQSENPEWNAITDAALAELKKDLAKGKEVHGDRNKRNTVIHDLAAIDLCQFLQPILSPKTADLADDFGQTPLHIAAEHGHLESVDILLKNGAQLKPDDDGWTPLHSTAASATPCPGIVWLIVEQFRKHESSKVNHQTSKGNTALHLAAGNPASTDEFIAAFTGVDATIQNDAGDMALHVAARSTSKDNIVMAMLRTFPPKKYMCKVKDIDTGRKTADGQSALITICAVNGNARAVAALTRNGADLIGSCVLHEIVRESVKNPNKIDGLLGVYGAIVDNSVAWWAVTTGNKCPKRENDDYNTTLRRVMLHLTSVKDGREGVNVIELAIDIGAGEMLLEILNTVHVYRKDIPVDDRLRTRYEYDTRFMITLHERVNAENEKQLSTGEEVRQHHGGPNWDDLERRPPATPYLSRIVGCDKHWRESKLLKMEPFREITHPMLRFVGRRFALFGTIQLIYMILFTIYCLPNRCALVDQFQLNFTDCNGNGSITATRNPSDRRLGVFLLWPAEMASFILVWSLCRPICYGLRNHRRQRIASSIGSLPEFARSTVSSVVDVLPKAAFCVSVFVWYAELCGSSSDPSWFPWYLESTSMVFLFGWMTTFWLFSGTSKRLYMFTIILGEIVVKDILSSFLPVFVFFVVGFGMAMHTLKQTTLPMDDVNSVNLTIFQVLMAGLTVSDDLSQTDEVYYAQGGRFGFYRVVYASFICFTAIVLLNVLIAMLGHRYSKAKVKAENVWRFDSVRMALPMYQFVRGPTAGCCNGRKCLRKLMSVLCYRSPFEMCGTETDESGDVMTDIVTVEMTIGPDKMMNTLFARQESREESSQFRHASVANQRRRRLGDVTVDT